MLGSTAPPWSSPPTSRDVPYWPAFDPTFHVASATPTPALAWPGAGLSASACGTTAPRASTTAAATIPPRRGMDTRSTPGAVRPASRLEPPSRRRRVTGERTLERAYASHRLCLRGPGAGRRLAVNGAGGRVGVRRHLSGQHCPPRPEVPHRVRQGV